MFIAIIIGMWDYIFDFILFIIKLIKSGFDGEKLHLGDNWDSNHKNLSKDDKPLLGPNAMTKDQDGTNSDDQIRIRVRGLQVTPLTLVMSLMIHQRRRI